MGKLENRHKLDVIVSSKFSPKRLKLTYDGLSLREYQKEESKPYDEQNVAYVGVDFAPIFISKIIDHNEDQAHTNDVYEKRSYDPRNRP